MSERKTRRELFGFLRRRPEQEEAPEEAPEREEAAAPAEAPRELSPWERRQQAIAAGRPDSVARLLAYACIGGSPSFCTVCVEHCPAPGALTVTGRAPRLDPDACTGCGICEEVCPAPDKAIHVLPRLPVGAPR